MAPPVHLGAFVHPFGPLPLPRNRTAARATLFIPALALPRARPAHPRVWGSGPYTDDSDVISAAVHAGCLRWSDVREARRRGRDARVEVHVVPAAERYIGNVGTAAETGGGGDPEDDGQGFFSAGWGNGHEGAGIEILDVAFVKVRCMIIAFWIPKGSKHWGTNRRLCSSFLAGRHGTSCPRARVRIASNPLASMPLNAVRHQVCFCFVTS